MDYRAIATISHYAGEDAQGVAIWEHHDFYCYADPIGKQKSYTLDGVQYVATHFYAFPHALTCVPGDRITVDGQERVVLAVVEAKHPKTRALVHTEVVGGQR